jgi:hypothetical protein
MHAVINQRAKTSATLVTTKLTAKTQIKATKVNAETVSPVQVTPKALQRTTVKNVVAQLTASRVTLNQKHSFDNFYD